MIDFPTCPFFYKFLCYFNRDSCRSSLCLQNYSLMCLLSYLNCFEKHHLGRYSECTSHTENYHDKDRRDFTL